jgi:hypothetical protein
MVRNDLLHAVASIDWAVFNLPSFETKIDAWLRDNVYADVIDVQGNTADQMVVAVEKELLPLSFVVEAGAYINAIRSSLDILASSLARRFGVAGDEQIQFPIASGLAAYRKRSVQGSQIRRGTSRARTRPYRRPETVSGSESSALGSPPTGYRSKPPKAAFRLCKPPFGIHQRVRGFRLQTSSFYRTG